jgi:O-antigen/teichoic acid export membrane protein
VTAQVDRHISQMFGRDALYMVLWAVQLLCAAGLTPLITRLLGATEFGVVASANAVMQVMFLMAGFGLYAAVQRQYERPGGKADAPRLLTAVIVLATLLAVVAVSTEHLWIGPLGLSSESTALRLAVLWGGSSAVTAASLALLRSQDRLRAFALVSLVQSVVAEAVSLALIAGDHATGRGFLLGQVLVQGMAMLLGLALAPPRAVGARHFAMVWSALRFSLPLVPAVLGTFVLSMADRLVVQGALGLEAVARYQVAYNAASVPLLLLSLLYSNWLPRFFALPDGAERAAVIAAGRDVLYRLLVPLMAGFAIGGPVLLRLWAPPSYRPETLSWVLLIVVVATVPFAAQLALAQAMTVQGRTMAIAATTVAAAAVNLVLNLWWVPVWGLNGSAAATLASYLLLAAILAGCTRRTTPMPRASVGVWVRLGVALLVATAATTLPATGAAFWIRIPLALAAAGWFLSRVAALRSRPGRHTGSIGNSLIRRAGTPA